MTEMSRVRLRPTASLNNDYSAIDWRGTAL
jgi:hypothetical protein